MEILGIKVDDCTRKQALQKVAEFLASGRPAKIFTPNPEMLVDAQTDGYFKKVLNSGDLNICDGRGIQLVAKKKLERIPGVDFMLDICQLAATRGSKIYLLGSGDKFVIKQTVRNLQTKFFDLKISGFDQGPMISTDGQLSDSDNEITINTINEVKPEILFVAFGHNKQEKWIYENSAKLPSVKIVMGVGGAFDYISGRVRRAPQWARRIGLEWLYRLAKEPGRIKRIYKATVVFLWLTLKYAKQ